MALHPQAKAILDLITAANRPATRDLPLAEGRAAYQASVDIFDTDKPQVHRVEDRSFTGPAGEVPLRVYWPRESDDALPILVYLHGGGWVIGDLDTHDRLCRRLASGGDCIVVSVDYRLAPEHPFPAAYDDCLAAIHWVADQGAGELGGDANRIAVGGDSAGGNLTAACALALRGEEGPNLALQLLIYPSVAPEPDSASHFEFAEGHLLTRDNLLWFTECYLGGQAAADDPRWAPLAVDDISGVAPAEIIVAGFDPLRDEGIAYGEKLRAAGISASVTNYEGMIHAFIQFYTALDDCGRAIEQAAKALKTAFAK